MSADPTLDEQRAATRARLDSALGIAPPAPPPPPQPTAPPSSPGMALLVSGLAMRVSAANWAAFGAPPVDHDIRLALPGRRETMELSVSALEIESDDVVVVRFAQRPGQDLAQMAQAIVGYDGREVALHSHRRRPFRVRGLLTSANCIEISYGELRQQRISIEAATWWGGRRGAVRGPTGSADALIETVEPGGSGYLAHDVVSPLRCYLDRPVAVRVANVQRRVGRAGPPVLLEVPRREEEQ
jgi:hypothetical protein